MDLRVVKDFIAEVLTVARWDDTGVTVDLIEPALSAAIEVGFTTEEIRELFGETE